MSKKAPDGLPKFIDRLAMDSLLYGVTKSLDYLGEQKQAVLDKMGDFMLDYLIGTGRVEPTAMQKEFARSLKKLLTENGYGSKVPLQFKGSPPAPSTSNFVGYLQRGSRRNRVRGTSTSKASRGGRGRIDWVLYEMALYGMTKALDEELGAQAQLILDRIGTKMLDYLLEKGVVEPNDDPEEFFQSVKRFFIRGGFAKETDFRFEGSPPRALVATWTNAPYYTNVLKRLQNEGSALFSCPVCLAGESILSKTQGLKFHNLVELRFLPRARVYYRHKIIPPGESFTEDDAQKLSRMALRNPDSVSSRA